MLTLAREARGLTQAELAEKVPSLSQSNYSKMEKGLLYASSETLNNIAEVLNFPITFFSTDNQGSKQAEYFYRKRVSMARKPQIKLEATFDLLRIWINNLLHSVEIPDMTLPAVKVYSNNTPELIAQKIRMLMDLPRGPIDRIVNLFERHGIIVYFMDDVPDKFDGTTLITATNQRIIVISNDLPNDRKRFTLAHEFGHIIMHIPFTPILDGDRDFEDEANRFAAEFLMPENDIRRDLVNFRYSIVGDLKQFWKTSKASIIRRAYDLKFIDKSRYNNMMIELSRSGERRTERSPVSIDSPKLIGKIVDTYLNSLEYTLEDLQKTISISSDDLKKYILRINPTDFKFKISV